MNKWDERFLNLAKEISTWSKDPSTQVGAVIVRPDSTITSVGFNGFPMKMEDNVEYLNNREEKYSRIIHGEINALIFAKESVRGHTLYTYPFASCDRCFVQCVQAGITRFVSPKIPTNLEERWGPILEKTRKYAKECNVELVEL